MQLAFFSASGWCQHNTSASICARRGAAVHVSAIVAKSEARSWPRKDWKRRIALLEYKRSYSTDNRTLPMPHTLAAICDFYEGKNQGGHDDQVIASGLRPCLEPNVHCGGESPSKSILHHKQIEMSPRTVPNHSKVVQVATFQLPAATWPPRLLRRGDLAPW
jgi:hypothetical protein